MPATSARRSRNVTALLLALPTLVIFAVFSWWPIILGATMSVQKTNFVGPAEWVGLSNFEYVLTDPQLGQAVLNTLWFVTLAILFGFPLPLALAVIISTVRTRWRGVYAALAYFQSRIATTGGTMTGKYARAA